MKYIIFEVDGVRKVPLIFPEILTHKEVAKAIIPMLKGISIEPVKVISAGDYKSMNGECSGRSESLHVSSSRKDAATIQMFDCFHGIDQI